MALVIGSVTLRKRQSGRVWYMGWRYRSGKDARQLLGPAWEKRTTPPDGHYRRKEAEEALEALLTDLRRGTIPDPGERSGKTFADAVAEWLRYVRASRRPAGPRRLRYRNAARSSLLPEFGAETPLEADHGGDGSTPTARRLLTEGKVSRRTVQKLMVLTHGILKRAKALGWISANPAEEVEKVNLTRVRRVQRPRPSSRSRRSPARPKAMFGDGDHSSPPTPGCGPASCGRCAGAIIDFLAATVHVQRNMPAGGEEGTPKSGKGRSVPLIDDAARALDGLSRREEFTGPDDRVFCRADGAMLGEDALRDALYDGDGGGEGSTGKAFPARDRSASTICGTRSAPSAVQVFPLHDVQAYMGHANIQTTMIYAHHVPKVRRREAVRRGDRAGEGRERNAERKPGAVVAVEATVPEIAKTNKNMMRIRGGLAERFAA